MLDDFLALRASTSTPSGRLAAKKRASKRRGKYGGVTQRDSGTSRSVRSREVQFLGERRNAADRTAGVAAAPGQPSTAPQRTGERPGTTSASNRPTSSNASRIAAMNAAIAWVGGRSPPSASAASSGGARSAPRDPGRASAASTRPPGKTWTSGAKAIDAGRCVSRPPARIPGREAGRRSRRARVDIEPIVRARPARSRGRHAHSMWPSSGTRRPEAPSLLVTSAQPPTPLRTASTGPQDEIGPSCSGSEPSAGRSGIGAPPPGMP